MKNKKIIFMLVVLFSFFISVDAVDAKTYGVKLVTSADEINNGAADDYFITTNVNGINYAWLNDVVNANSRSIGTENALEVTINGNQLSILDSFASSALWTYGLSPYTIKSGLNDYTLIGKVNLYSNYGYGNQINFNSANNSSNPTGFEYVQYDKGYAVKLEYDGNALGEAKITQTVNNKKYYVQFSEKDKNFSTIEKEVSQTFKIYKIVEKERPIERFKPTEKGDVSFNKTKKKHETFEKTGIYQIDLTLSAPTIKRDVDVVFVLDYSSSMDAEEKITKMEASANYLADSLINFNENNRMGVVKFGFENMYEEDSIKLGLSNNLSKIKAFIDNDSRGVIAGTNYTAPMELAYQILEDNYVPNRDQIVVFITDGAPTIYNKSDFRVFEDTPSGNGNNRHAVDWYNYISKYELLPLRKLKEKNIEIVTVGVGTNVDASLFGNNTHIMRSEWVQTLLNNFASSEASSVFVDNLDKINDVFKDMFISKLYIEDVTVKDAIKDKYKLVIDDYKDFSPYIEVKKANGELVERIDFNGIGTEAFSNLKGSENIIETHDDTRVLNAEYFYYNFDSKVIRWKIDQINEDEIQLTYFIRPEELADSYKDDAAIDGTVDVDYDDYDDTETSYSYEVEDEDKVAEDIFYEIDQNEENPDTVASNPLLYIIVLIITSNILKSIIRRRQQKKLPFKSLKTTI